MPKQPLIFLQMSNLPPELQHINPNGPWLPHEADWEGNKKDVFEDDDRLKIFVQPANTGGCAFYRCWQPFKKLGEKHSDDYLRYESFKD